MTNQKKFFTAMLGVFCALSAGCIHQVVTVPAQAAGQSAQTAGQTAQQVVAIDGQGSDRQAAINSPVPQQAAPQ